MCDGPSLLMEPVLMAGFLAASAYTIRPPGELCRTGAVREPEREESFLRNDPGSSHPAVDPLARPRCYDARDQW